MTSKVSLCYCSTLLTCKTKTTDYWNSHPFNPKTHGDYFWQVVGLWSEQDMSEIEENIFLECHCNSHCCTDEKTSYETQSLFEKIPVKVWFSYTCHISFTITIKFSFSLWILFKVLSRPAAHLTAAQSARHWRATLCFWSRTPQSHFTLCSVFSQASSGLRG